MEEKNDDKNFSAIHQAIPDVAETLPRPNSAQRWRYVAYCGEGPIENYFRHSICLEDTANPDISLRAHRCFVDVIALTEEMAASKAERIAHALNVVGLEGVEPSSVHLKGDGSPIELQTQELKSTTAQGDTDPRPGDPTAEDEIVPGAI